MLKGMDNDQFLQEILQKNYSQHLRQLKTPISLKKNLQDKDKTHKSYKCLVDSINFESGKKIISFYNKDFETHKKASYVLSPKPLNFYNNKFKASRLFEPSYNSDFKYKSKSLNNLKQNSLKYKPKQLSVRLPPIIKSPKIEKTKNFSPKESKLFGSRSVNLHVRGESQIPLYINHDRSKHLYDLLFTDDYSKNLEGEENFGELDQENFGDLDEENLEVLDKNVAEIF